MERFGTFKVDHTKLNKGIYSSGLMKDGVTKIFTIDIRTCGPYRDSLMSNVVMHSVEHIMATALQDSKDLKKVYFGPMGCQTGFYYLFRCRYKKLEPKQVGIELLNAARSWDGKSIPFNSEIECGNMRTLATTESELEDVRIVMDLIARLAEKVILNNEFDQYSFI